MRWFLLKSIGSSLRYLLAPFLRANAVVSQYAKSLVSIMKSCAWVAAVSQFLRAALRIFAALADQCLDEDE
ncbi:MAG: hypothetical protein JOZ62_12965 [Acidobacteriaceae bacterium]|nr:hypothetical protein [Acidobacteriaceae bacterium]